MSIKDCKEIGRKVTMYVAAVMVVWYIIDMW